MYTTQEIEDALRRAQAAGDAQAVTILTDELKSRYSRDPLVSNAIEATRFRPEKPIDLYQKSEFWFLFIIGIGVLFLWRSHTSQKNNSIFFKIPHFIFLLLAAPALVWAMQMNSFIGLFCGLLVACGCLFFRKSLITTEWVSVLNFVILVTSSLLFLVKAIKLLPGSPYENRQDYYEDRRAP
jgi:hypothetical protein